MPSYPVDVEIFYWISDNFDLLVALDINHEVTISSNMAVIYRDTWQIFKMYFTVSYFIFFSLMNKLALNLAFALAGLAKAGSNQGKGVGGGVF